MIDVLLGFAALVLAAAAYVASVNGYPMPEYYIPLIGSAISFICLIGRRCLSHLRKVRAKRRRNETSRQIVQFVEKVNDLHTRLCACFRNTTNATEIGRMNAALKQTITEIEEWVIDVALELDQLRSGWGGRFKAIGKPTQHQCSSGHRGGENEKIGELVLYREKLSELLADIDRK